jgi:hypothetical protein
VSGTVGTTIVNGGKLGGSGTTGGVTNNTNGTIEPGLVAGTTHILNTGSLTGGGTYFFQLNGTTAGSGYDQLNTTGSINLTGSILNVGQGFTPTVGTNFTLIHNVNNTPITGTFSALLGGSPVALPEGAVWNFGGHTFQIHYTEGASHDVVLSRADFPAYEESLDASGNLVITQSTLYASANDNLSVSLSGGTYTFSPARLLSAAVTSRVSRSASASIPTLSPWLAPTLRPLL